MRLHWVEADNPSTLVGVQASLGDKWYLLTENSDAVLLQSLQLVRYTPISEKKWANASLQGLEVHPWKQFEEEQVLSQHSLWVLVTTYQTQAGGMEQITERGNTL